VIQERARKKPRYLSCPTPSAVFHLLVVSHDVQPTFRERGIQRRMTKELMNTFENYYN
jgi:hypothetical protein